MNTTDTGGPAFPLYIPALETISLRDYFAAKAMEGWFSCPLPNDDNINEVAEWSYRTADAMLKARKA